MQISIVGSLSKRESISGFSLMELIVVLFILSILAFFTIPVFKAPDSGQRENAGDSRALAAFIEAVRQKAVLENRDYLLHLDLINAKIWATATEADGPSEVNDAGVEFQLSKGSLSRVELLDPADTPLENTVVGISGNGTTDMALIRLATEDGDMTLKLHPFIMDVEIIQGAQSFNDCF